MNYRELIRQLTPQTGAGEAQAIVRWVMEERFGLTQTDLLLKNPATRQLIRDLMMEVIDAANHLGVKGLDASFADKMIETTDAMTPYSPSMKLDFDFHRPMEIHYLYSRPIEIAREAGFRMRKLEMLEAELKFLQKE